MISNFCNQERPHICFWLDKLQTVSGDKKALMTRNNYMWLLLLAMQSDKLAEPFDRLPPTNELPPISDIMVLISFIYSPR